MLGMMIFMYSLIVTLSDYLGIPTDIFQIWALITNQDPTKTSIQVISILTLALNLSIIALFEALIIASYIYIEIISPGKFSAGKLATWNAIFFPIMLPHVLQFIPISSYTFWVHSH